jgi:Flp pilus assembly protein protease CpaA
MFFIPLILVIGALTTYTDLKDKKIYNVHLIIIAVLGLFATAYASIVRHDHVLFHYINGIAAFVIGLLLHRSAIWRGGDAKLFALFAFLMPLPEYNHILLPGAIDLFACSFLAGMIVLAPVFIKDILINYKAIWADLSLPAKRMAIFDAIGTVFVSSWVLFPFLYLARITDPVILLMVSYLFFNWGYSIKKGFKEGYIIEFIRKKSLKLSILFLFGLSMRFWLAPGSLSFHALSGFVVRITLAAALSTFIRTTFDHFKDYQERVPFAPLLFIGCLLSYTPFLIRLIQMMSRWNVLFSR